MGLYKSIGTLRYSDWSYTLILDCDPSLMNYYRAMIPKWHGYANSNRPMYDAHVSVVRKELPTELDRWKKWNGREVEFFYNGIIRAGEVYRWIDIWSSKLDNVRMELGLPVIEEWTEPPKGFLKTYHITIGNLKNI